MNIGIMLPLGGAFAQDESARIEEALSLGYSTLWLQEWPGGSGPEGHRDHATGHDPLLYATHLAQRYGPRGAQIGLAVLRLDYRQPLVAARAVVSAQVLGGQPLLLGMGAATHTPEAAERTARSWLEIRSLLRSGPDADAFLLPAGFTPPPMLLASGKPEVWSSIDYLADGLLTTHFHPREIEAITAPMRQRVRELEIVVQVFWRIDTQDADAMRPAERRSLLIGSNHVRALAALWKQVGVTAILYFPPETPSETQLRLFAEAVQGGAS